MDLGNILQNDENKTNDYRVNNLQQDNPLYSVFFNLITFN